MSAALRDGTGTANDVVQARSVAGIARRGALFFIARRKADTTEMSLRWEFPGGKVEVGETDEGALEREFNEEFMAPIKVLHFWGESVFVHRGKSRALAAWEIELEPDSIGALEEHSEAAWMPFELIAELDLADSDKSLLPIIEAHLRAQN